MLVPEELAQNVAFAHNSQRHAIIGWTETATCIVSFSFVRVRGWLISPRPTIIIRKHTPWQDRKIRTWVLVLGRSFFNRSRMSHFSSKYEKKKSCYKAFFLFFHPRSISTTVLANSDTLLRRGRSSRNNEEFTHTFIIWTRRWSRPGSFIMASTILLSSSLAIYYIVSYSAFSHILAVEHDKYPACCLRISVFSPHSAFVRNHRSFDGKLHISKRDIIQCQVITPFQKGHTLVNNSFSRPIRLLHSTKLTSRKLEALFPF